MGTRKQNGEGSLYFSKSLNRWVIQYTDPMTKKAKKIVQKKKETDKDFKKKYFKIINDINEQKYSTKNNITLLDIMQKQTEILYKANKIKDSSYLRRKHTTDIVAKMNIANIPIQNITIIQINNDLCSITNYADNTISKVYSSISSAFDYAMAYNIIQSNPFARKDLIVKPKSTKQTKKVDALTYDEQIAFEQELAKSNDKYKNVFYILLFSGARVGEILALTGKDIDIKNNIIHISKTLTKSQNGTYVLGSTKTYSGTRNIPIISKLRPILVSMNLRDNFLFLYNNHFISPSTINTHFKKICKDSNIRVIINHNKLKTYNGKKIKVNLRTSEVNTHMLRHTFATRCIEAGMSAVALSKILGHADIQTTLNTYTSVFNKFQKSELDKVEKYLNAM